MFPYTTPLHFVRSIITAKYSGLAVAGRQRQERLKSGRMQRRHLPRIEVSELKQLAVR